MRHWSALYVGLPFAARGRDRAGLDCWGLVRLVYAEQLGIDLPSYVEDYASIEELVELHGLMRGAIDDGEWISTEEPRHYDVLLFRRGRYDSHVGLYVSRGLMMHVTANDCVKVENYQTSVWRPRYMGAYRRAGL
jgi:cell wall-associated NlpC family hydrolase